MVRFEHTEKGAKSFIPTRLILYVNLNCLVIQFCSFALKWCSEMESIKTCNNNGSDDTTTTNNINRRRQDV